MAEPKIGIKSSYILRQLMERRYHPMLIEVVIAVVDEFGLAMITSAFRPGDDGVHGTDPCRGIDLRSWVYEFPKKVEKWINDNFEYDYKRPEKDVAWIHDTGRGIHFHIQSHPHTRRRKTSNA